MIIFFMTAVISVCWTGYSNKYGVARKKRSVLTRPDNVTKDRIPVYRITEQNIREPVVLRSHRKLVSSDHLFNGDIPNKAQSVF